MHISSLESDTNAPLYYSLSFPTLLEGSPRNTTGSTIMLDLKDIKRIIETVTSTFNTSNKLNNILDTTTFNFFHVEPDKYKEIDESKELAKYDPSLLIFQESFPSCAFCNTSPFWRGSVLITR